jgi:type I restriction enzyme M protein
MAKKAKVAERSLDSILWNGRNALRGTVGGNEKNRDAVMGLVFLMFAGCIGGRGLSGCSVTGFVV